jgi:hypothetical protein
VFVQDMWIGDVQHHALNSDKVVNYDFVPPASPGKLFAVPPASKGVLTTASLLSMYIARHDRAVLAVLAAMRQGNGGGSYTIVDACRAEELAQHCADAKRLPGWLLPEVSAEERGKMRPDILRVLGLPATPTPEQVEHAVANKRLHTVQVVEVGYTSDTRWQQKLLAKREQHAHMIAEMRAAGWRVELHVVLVGRAGTVYKTGLRAALTLGMTAMAAKTLLTQLSIQAIGAMHDIACARRRLERRPQRAGVG